MSVNRLADHLYNTFWERNQVEVPPLDDQAAAIIKMWTNIAVSALEFKEENDVT